MTMTDQDSGTTSTPGNEFPGAWKDKSSTDTTNLYHDVKSTMSSVGQTAYTYLPAGVKNALGGGGDRA